MARHADKWYVAGGDNFLVSMGIDEDECFEQCFDYDYDEPHKLLYTGNRKGVARFAKNQLQKIVNRIRATLIKCRGYRKIAYRYLECIYAIHYENNHAITEHSPTLEAVIREYLLNHVLFLGRDVNGEKRMDVERKWVPIPDAPGQIRLDTAFGYFILNEVACDETMVDHLKTYLANTFNETERLFTDFYVGNVYDLMCADIEKLCGKDSSSYRNIKEHLQPYEYPH